MKEALLMAKGPSSGGLTENNIVFTPVRLREVNLPFIDATKKIQYFTDPDNSQTFTVVFPVTIKFGEYYLRGAINASYTGDGFSDTVVTPIDPTQIVEIYVT